MLGDDAVHDRETKPRPFADALGGEERLEDALQRHLVHAAASVFPEIRTGGPRAPQLAAACALGSGALSRRVTNSSAAVGWMPMV